MHCDEEPNKLGVKSVLVLRNESQNKEKVKRMFVIILKIKVCTRIQGISSSKSFGKQFARNFFFELFIFN